MLGPSYKIARVFGIPIKAHVSLIVLLPVIAVRLSTIPHISLLWGFIFAVSLFVFVALHELGHSLVANRMGCHVREITLTFVGGVAQLEGIPTRPRDEILMAVAGPAVSLTLCAVFVTAGSYLPASRAFATGLPLLPKNGVQFLGFVNLVLALFNLVPAFPMDGGRVLRALLARRLGRLRATKIAVNIGKIMCVVFLVIGITYWQSHWFLIVIAVLIFMAAQSEYRSVLIKEEQKRYGYGGEPGDGAAPSDDEVTVSPPPFRKGPNARIPLRHVRRRRDWFDLFNG
ncbi:MAG: site-2 protease family protein [Kiritimatiellae bacterium]|nr:site-2 protease family protein [Kiritimatiellia bacterium]